MLLRFSEVKIDSLGGGGGGGGGGTFGRYLRGNLTWGGGGTNDGDCIVASTTAF